MKPRPLFRRPATQPMVEVFSAPLPDYPNFDVWHENPPGCWTPPSDSRPGSSRSREAPYASGPTSETEKDTKIAQLRHFLTTCCMNVTFLITEHGKLTTHPFRTRVWRIAPDTSLRKRNIELAGERRSRDLRPLCAAVPIIAAARRRRTAAARRLEAARTPGDTRPLSGGLQSSLPSVASSLRSSQCRLADTHKTRRSMTAALGERGYIFACSSAIFAATSASACG